MPGSAKAKRSRSLYGRGNVSGTRWPPELNAPPGPPSLFSDNFNRADGAIGNDWIGATWTITGNQAMNTPTLGAERLTNTEFTTNTTGWTAINSAVMTRRDYSSSPNIGPTGGADNFGVEVASSGNFNSAARQQPASVINTWYLITARAYSPAGNTAPGTTDIRLLNAIVATSVVTQPTTWQTLAASGRATTTLIELRLRSASSVVGELAHFDAPSIKPITLSSLFATRNLGQSAVDARADITLAGMTQAGLIVNLDSAATPANFVLGHHDGVNANLVKCVAGTYTSLIAAAATYNAGAALEIKQPSANTYQLWYNGVQIGTDQAIADAGIISNTLHGLFSTYGGNRIDNVVFF